MQTRPHNMSALGRHSFLDRPSELNVTVGTGDGGDVDCGVQLTGAVDREEHGGGACCRETSSSTTLGVVDLQPQRRRRAAIA